MGLLRAIKHGAAYTTCKLDIRKENFNIRQFYVPRKSDLNKPLMDLDAGSWKAANLQNLMDFSATAWFFAKALYRQYGVPIGLINTALGGSPAEAWLSEETLRQFPVYYQDMQ